MHLSDKGLLPKNGTGHFWLHNIVRNSLKSAEPELLRQAHLRAVNFYRNQEMPESPQSIDDYASVLEWHYHAVEAADVISAYSALYSTGLHDQLMKWNEYGLLVRLCEQTLSVVYQIEADLSRVEANLSNSERIKIYHSLGVVYFLLGDFISSIAHLTVALKLLETQDDRELRIKLLIDLAESHNSAGDSRSATELCQQLETLLAHTKYEMLQAKFLHLQGIINRDQGNLERAASDFQNAIELYANLHDDLHLANCTGDLGVVYYQQHRFEEAIENHQRAMKIYETRQDTRMVAIAHYNIADIMLQIEKYEPAKTEAQLVLDLARRRKLRNVELFACMVLVEAQIAMLKLDDAQQELARLKQIIGKNESPCILGQEKYLMASLDWKCGHLTQAKEYFAQAFELFEKANCEEQKARAQPAFSAFMKELEASG
jgi:tetratricopeptide (TPR) repeat protein